MFFSARTHLIIVGARPIREADRLVGKLVKCLLDELRASQPMMDPLGITTAFGHSGNSGVRLHFDGRLPARTIRAECGRQTRSTNLAGAGQTVEDIVVPVL